MEKLYASEIPESIELIRRRVKTGTGEWVEKPICRVLNFCICETAEEELSNLWQRHLATSGDAGLSSDGIPDWFCHQHRWQYFRLEFPMGMWGYDVVVSAIIRAKYTTDRMEAIMNNILGDNANEKRKNEFAEMQAWREVAKVEAKKIFER